MSARIPSRTIGTRPAAIVVGACAMVALAMLVQAAPQPPAGAARPPVPVPVPVPAPAPVSGRDAFAETRAVAATLPSMHSLLVSRRGDLIFEYYAAGRGPARLANIKSASKSIIAALIGIAIDRRLIEGVSQPIVTFFPELRRDPDPRKAAITVEDLLTMRSGLESTSGEGYGPWVRSRNWVRYVLARPIVSAPGTGMEYSTGTSHLLSAILAKVSKTGTRQFAQQALAGPLGFTLARWPRDPQGIDFGGNEMLMTPRQMIAVGELYRQRGQVGGRRLLSAAWVETSCVPRTRSRWDPDREYGYGWWIQEIGGRQACFAWGFGGQYILVFRDLDLVIAITSSTTVSDERHDYRRRLFDLLAAHVLPAAAG